MFLYLFTCFYISQFNNEYHDKYDHSLIYIRCTGCWFLIDLFKPVKDTTLLKVGNFILKTSNKLIYYNCYVQIVIHVILELQLF